MYIDYILYIYGVSVDLTGKVYVKMYLLTWVDCTTFRLCPFLSATPSNAAPFARYTRSNAFNARSTSSIILAEEDAPIFDSRVRFSPLAITTLILEWRYASVGSDCPQQLTSYAVTPHLSPNCHISLMWCGDCLLKCYWHLFYT